MAHIEIARDEIRDLDRGLTREWLVTNRIGGYASGTVVGINTRRYHGLLIAATQPPVGRTALLVRLDAVLTIDGRSTELMAAEYADGTIYPRGFEHLESFSLEDDVPTWQYALGNVLLRQTLWMVPDHNITAIRYKLVSGAGPVELSLRPLTAARDHHAVQHGNPEWRFAVDPVPNGIRVQAHAEAPPLWLLARGAEFVLGGDWYWRYLLPVERDRGYDHVEDLYQPGTFRATLMPGGSLTLIASAEDPTEGLPDVDVAMAARRSAHARVLHPVPAAPDRGAPGGDLAALRAALTFAADAFPVQRTPAAGADRPLLSLIAGYHWFTDWGRDSMIALPGLFLATGRPDDAAALLRTYAAAIDRGMVPNRFPDSGETAEYNTADASLLFFQALRHTLAALERSPGAGDAEALLAELYPRLREIVEWHRRGTRYGIAVDQADGLLRAGLAGSTDASATQLTWMDARTGNTVYTPRVGKPVEINALWIAALELMAGWAPRAEDDPEPYRLGAARARAAFAARFWYAEGGYLYDVVDGPDGDDPSLRPNQIVALALDPTLVPAERARSALSAASAHLLTPYGLRSLSPEDPLYRGQCAGDQPTRDRAYHQGTVWTWLLGPYADLHRHLHGDRDALRALLLPFGAHLREAGLGSVSEIFDGDPPHTPRGCIAQAWSVGELLRIAGLLDA